MNKQELFLAAMSAQEFRRRAWVISAFALINEAPDAWKSDPYPYRIVQTPTGHFCVRGSESKGWVLELIADAPAGRAPFDIKERVSYTPKQIEMADETVQATLDKPTEATCGQWLTNYTVNFWPFGNKLGFIPGRFSPSQLEDIIVKRLADDPPAGSLDGAAEPQAAARTAPIYVSEYLRFCDAMFYLAGFTQICVPGSTEKSLVPAPGIRELRAKLLAENKDRLHDPAVVAKIQAELIAYDRNYLKGDPSENFLLGKKSFEVVRSKMFGMHGAEVGLAEGATVKIIPTSLSEGLDVSHWDTYNDSLRAGSFNRGAQTMLGGESVKWLLRASSNITVTTEDCGSLLGNDFAATPENYKWLTGFHVIEGKASKPVVSDEDAKSYISKRLKVRSPMFCKLGKTDYCKVCVGSRLAENPTGLSSAISAYGSAFLAIYMAAAHGKQLTLAKMEIKTAIS